MPKNRIRMLRGIGKLSYAEVAARIGVTENTVRRWEAGTTQIPDVRKLELAELFGVAVPFMMGWPDTPANGNGHDDERAAA